MKAIDIHGMTNMELVRGETDEWYWATDYIHGDLYEAEELFRQGHPVRSNRICAFCRRSLGGFSVVSVQPCPLQSYSGSKLGQRL